VFKTSIAFGLFLAATFLPARGARADVTSWMSAGAGYALERNRVIGENDFATSLTYSLGVGTSPLKPFVIGGLARGTTLINLGTDVGVAVRASTGGFARGDWGVAVEAGALWRPWRDGNYGSWPLQGVVTVGAPWGFQVAAGVEIGTLTNELSAEGGFVALELDLLRLTVMRQGATEKWWPNPAPAGGHEAGQGAGLTRISGLCSSALIE
jgi:hypothetical protein